MKAQVLEKHGRKEFVILLWEDYQKIHEMLEDYDDLRELRGLKKNPKGINQFLLKRRSSP